MGVSGARWDSRGPSQGAARSTGSDCSQERHKRPGAHTDRHRQRSERINGENYQRTPNNTWVPRQHSLVTPSEVDPVAALESVTRHVLQGWPRPLPTPHRTVTAHVTPTASGPRSAASQLKESLQPVVTQASSSRAESPAENGGPHPYGLCTSRENSKTRSQALHASWGPRCARRASTELPFSRDRLGRSRRRHPVTPRAWEESCREEAQGPEDTGRVSVGSGGRGHS